MAEPVLLEVQQREREILGYLSRDLVRARSPRTLQAATPLAARIAHARPIR